MSNNLLQGTDSCLDHVGLKNALTINMTDSLASHIRCLPDTECQWLLDLKFELWVPTVVRIDTALSGNKRQMEEIAQNLINKHPKTDDKSSYDDRNYSRSYASGANTVTREFRSRTSDQNQLPTDSQNRVNNSNARCPRCCPLLTDNEQRVLAAHDGCFKCRMPYVKHFTRDCPTGFPIADNYEPRTEAWCLCHKPKAVASVHGAYINTFPDRQLRASTSRARISPAPQTPPWSNIAVLPSVNFVLEGDSDGSPTPSLSGDRLCWVYDPPIRLYGKPSISDYTYST